MSMSKITINEPGEDQRISSRTDAFIQRIGYLPNDLAAGTVAFV